MVSPLLHFHRTVSPFDLQFEMLHVFTEEEKDFMLLAIGQTDSLILFFTSP